MTGARRAGDHPPLHRGEIDRGLGEAAGKQRVDADEGDIGMKALEEGEARVADQGERAASVGSAEDEQLQALGAGKHHRCRYVVGADSQPQVALDDDLGRLEHGRARIEDDALAGLKHRRGPRSDRCLGLMGDVGADLTPGLERGPVRLVKNGPTVAPDDVTAFGKEIEVAPDG